MLNEADTRAKLIDPKLKEAGWTEDNIEREKPVTKGKIINENGDRLPPKKIDYVLYYPDIYTGIPIAVIEAEKEGPKWAEIEDKRVTKVGKFLRRFHLDEIPQMINVIRGDISLVGPRPERPEFVEKLEKEIPYYNLRHIIKPGFTGWAQIKFRYARSVMDSLEKFQYDLFYIKNRSLLLDLKILLKTAQLIFKKE
jgi:hypothetical protein